MPRSRKNSSDKTRFVEFYHPPFQSARCVRVHRDFDANSPNDKDNLSPNLIGLWRIDSFKTTGDSIGESDGVNFFIDASLP